MIYKFTCARKFFKGLPSSHFVEGMHEHLAVGLKFLVLWLMKIEPNHPIPAFDSLLVRLEEQLPSNWDILASPEQ